MNPDSVSTALTLVKEGRLDEALALIGQDPALATATNDQGTTLAQLAYYFGHKELAVELASKVPNLDMGTACVVGDLAAVKARLAEGVDINALSADGGTPLCFACFFGHDEIAQVLLDAGADVNKRSTAFGGVAPLHSAVASRRFDIVKMLVEKGAAVNETQAGGFTPLHGAAQNGDVDMVHYLLEHGADTSALTDAGKSAADFARDNGNPILADKISVSQ